MTRAERDELILSLKPLVQRIAHAKLAGLPPMMRLDDIVSAGWLGAIKAVDRFDPAKNVPLPLYARWQINGAIGDYLRSLDPVSRGERRKLKADPNLEPPRTFSMTPRPDCQAFDIADKRSYEAVRRIEGRLDLAKIVCRTALRPRSLRIVMRHAHGETMKDIGRSEGINESRVSQIRTRTLAKLRAAA